MIYLDYFATTPCATEVVDAMLPWFAQDFANPHSTHAPGQKAAKAIEGARQSVGELVGADPREIIFTSGATEANNIAIKGAARHARRVNNQRKRMITCATEHKCVLESVKSLEAEGFEVVILGVDRNGLVDVEHLRAALLVPTALVSVMAANNETGVVQDIAQLGAVSRAAGAVFHTDLAQMAGKLPVTLENVDLASLSAHKMYGPKGVGALYMRRRPRARVEALFSGGAQERGVRSGTLPTPLVVGFGEAARLAKVRLTQDAAQISELRDLLWKKLREGLPGVVLNGAKASRLPGGLNFCLPEGVSALDVMAQLPDIAMSTGSACSAAELAPSYVLTAMGLPSDEAARCLRLSVGRYTSNAEIERAAALLTNVARVPDV
ncbi:cysteine desulfurase [Neokomagataea thailandica NBRC 106555]|uniref:Cysteine desulfurase n=2 Tax=Neokomagataea TaxID=1223423 RepID=A0A4Y6V8L2_9PROT|nr:MULTISPECIES: cysteine desulfurase family protein [Neokomagataea]QDH25010.1 cysteine desulfurase [Neokomagataea tanensis]GBR51508.1 cysteine desulfurase [Neokomagataea thailandica NBRC 106555]